jgi:hypothetical protein
LLSRFVCVCVCGLRMAEGAFNVPFVGVLIGVSVLWSRCEARRVSEAFVTLDYRRAAFGGSAGVSRQAVPMRAPFGALGPVAVSSSAPWDADALSACSVA